MSRWAHLLFSLRKCWCYWFEFYIIIDYHCIWFFSTHPASWIVGNLFFFYAGTELSLVLFCKAKECRVQEARQTSPTANKENIKPLDSSPSIIRPICKGRINYSKRLMCHTCSLLKILWDFVEIVSSNTSESTAKCQILSLKHLLNCLFTGPSMAPDHRKQIDNLKKFSVDFRVSLSFIITV